MVNPDKTSAQLERSTMPPQERNPGTHHYKKGSPSIRDMQLTTIREEPNTTSGEEPHNTLQLLKKTSVQCN